MTLTVKEQIGKRGRNKNQSKQICSYLSKGGACATQRGAPAPGRGLSLAMAGLCRWVTRGQARWPGLETSVPA